LLSSFWAWIYMQNHIQILLFSDVHYLFQQLLLAIAQQHQGKVVVASMDCPIREKADHTAQNCIYGHLGIDEVVVALPPWGSLLHTRGASRRFHFTNTFFTSICATYGVKINRTTEDDFQSFGSFQLAVDMLNNLVMAGSNAA